MRGHVDRRALMFTYFAPEARVSVQHPLRSIKAKADAMLGSMSGEFLAFRARTRPTRTTALIVPIWSPQNFGGGAFFAAIGWQRTGVHHALLPKALRFGKSIKFVPTHKVLSAR